MMPTKTEILRRLLFPAVAMDIITGYNIYPETVTPPDAVFCVSYLHNKLSENDEHFRELERKVTDFGMTLLLEPEWCQRVDRTAAYLLEGGWEADEYYDARGQEIKKECVDKHIKQGVPVIGVSKQYDLRIGVNNRKNLEALLEIFRKHANAYLINKKTGKIITYPASKGRTKKQNRKHKISDAWEVPFISIDTGEPVQLPGYQSVRKIYLEGFDIDISLLIDRKWDGRIVHPEEAGLVYPTFQGYLRHFKVQTIESDSIINKVLADHLNKVDWRKLRCARQVLELDKI